MKYMRILSICIILLVLLASCQNDVKTAKDVYMHNDSGDMIGLAKLSERPDGVEIMLDLEGLTPGFHGIHIHEYPKCEGPDFISAGNHFSPEAKEHGLMHPEGAHLGDLPNIEADHNGQASAEIMIEEATILTGKTSIIAGEGTSLIIKEGQDDGVSQPGGDPGKRIVCGVISNQEETVEPPTDPTETNDKQEEE